MRCNLYEIWQSDYDYIKTLSKTNIFFFSKMIGKPPLKKAGQNMKYVLFIFTLYFLNMYDLYIF